MSRIDWDTYFIKIAYDVSLRSTCLRRPVGCVIVDSQNRIISTGYNGVARGMPHCNYKSDISKVSLGEEWIHPYACEGVYSPSGNDLSKCVAIHAEQNALMQCPDVFQIETVYVTTSPCMEQCMKLLLNTSVCRIVYREKYSHHEDTKRLCDKMGIHLHHNPWQVYGRRFPVT